MAFTYDITTDRGKVRFGIGDTVSSVQMLSDAEVDHCLTTAGTVALAIEYGLRALLAAHTTRGDAVRAQGVRDRLATTGGDLPTVDVIFPASLPSDQGFTEPTT